MKQFFRGASLLTLIFIACTGCRAKEPQPAPLRTPLPEATSTEEFCTYDAELLDSSEAGGSNPLAAGQKTQTRLKIKNTGSCDWVDIVLVPADPSDSESTSVPVPATAAHASTAVEVELAAPSMPGEYETKWTLRTSDGTVFGPELNVKLSVIPPATPQTPYGILAGNGCVFDAEFVEDVSILDGTVAKPDEALHKVWRVKNIGTCGWQPGFTLNLLSGDSLGSPSSVPIPSTQPGDTAEVTIDFQAPKQNGVYASWWQLQSDEGEPFGAGLFAKIRVGEAVAAYGSSPSQTAYTPYIHNISFHSRQIFLDGQTKGNRANVFSKVGDSITDVWAFLKLIGDGVYILGEYDYLRPVINYFSGSYARTGNSFNNTSLAAVSGWSSYDVVNPDKVAGVCPGMTPTACEFSIVKPSVAIIMIGTNDTTAAFDRGDYEAHIRQIVEDSIDAGVIPVLSTLPYDQWGDPGPYNQIIIAMAVEYDVPWMDFYSATWNLPNHGISAADGVHPSVPPGNDPTNFSADNLQYGFTVRNLLVLHVLDALWRQVLSY